MGLGGGLGRGGNTANCVACSSSASRSLIARHAAWARRRNFEWQTYSVTQIIPCSWVSSA